MSAVVELLGDDGSLLLGNGVGSRNYLTSRKCGAGNGGRNSVMAQPFAGLEVKDITDVSFLLYTLRNGNMRVIVASNLQWLLKSEKSLQSFEHIWIFDFLVSCFSDFGCVFDLMNITKYNFRATSVLPYILQLNTQTTLFSFRPLNSKKNV